MNRIEKELVKAGHKDLAKELLHAGKDDIDCGFSISTSDEDSIKEDAEEEHMGEIDWKQINKDIAKIEKNALKWLRKFFANARDEGHDSHGDLIGTLWVDPDNEDQMEMIGESSSEHSGEPLRTSSGTMPNTADRMIFNGVSKEGSILIQVTIDFFNVDEDDFEGYV